jgi:hypothetical protein
MEISSIRKAERFEKARLPTQQPLSLSTPQLFVIFAAGLLAIDIARRPSDMFFDRFAFFDNGANLTLQYLTSIGYRPAIDFGYHYGLLAVLIGRVWFGCLGTTPAAYQWAMVTGAVLFAWALAKIFAGRKIGAEGLALLIVSLGIAYQSNYPNLAHCIEAVILAHALAAQVRGSYRNSLALATIAVFVKPSMGYVFGGVLLLLKALELRRDGGTVRDFIAIITPSAIIFAVLTVVLISVYGAQSFLFTIVPIEGVTLYRAVHFGLVHGPGRYLWNPEERPLPLYFIEIPAFWMASTVYLVTAGIEQAWNYIRDKRLTRGGEVIVTCALLHLAFVFIFFGSAASWIYYSYLLAIGCGLATETGKGWRLAAIPLCALALLSWSSTAAFNYRQWKTTSPGPVTAGLWAPPAEAGEWNKVLSLARQEKMVVVDTKGAVELMYPEFGKPVSMFLDPGLETQEDVARKAAQISAASAFVVPQTVLEYGGLPDAPEIAAAMRDFELEWKGEFFSVYRRRAGKSDAGQ